MSDLTPRMFGFKEQDRVRYKNQPVRAGTVVAIHGRRLYVEFDRPRAGARRVECLTEERWTKLESFYDGQRSS